MDETRNLVQLRGTAAGEPALSHENHGQQFYRFPLSVRRLSGQADLLHVIATGEQLRGLLPLEGRRLAVDGQLRSFNNKSGCGSKLVISVFARTLEETEEEEFNSIQLRGVICKPPVLRRTPRMEVGDTLALEGRVQSRVYTKVVDGCAQERTAFEVSVMHLLEDSEV